jgi:hypothetical protein
MRSAVASGYPLQAAQFFNLFHLIKFLSHIVHSSTWAGFPLLSLADASTKFIKSFKLSSLTSYLGLCLHEPTLGFLCVPLGHLLRANKYSLRLGLPVAHLSLLLIPHPDFIGVATDSEPLWGSSEK